MKVITVKHCKNGEAVLITQIERDAHPKLYERQDRASARERRKVLVRLYATRFSEGRPIFDE